MSSSVGTTYACETQAGNLCVEEPNPAHKQAKLPGSANNPGADPLPIRQSDAGIGILAMMLIIWTMLRR
jgi:hypothetical protein